ncbi:hypothetical protein FACS1894180_3490 [Bacteroidia bacterium]|nr:hypothetical protein FACS1894180_3490 [Bacteroidia bacterium]
MKKIGLIIILLVSTYAVNAQGRIVQNIVLSTPVIDSLKINPDLHFCGIVREMELNCLNNEFVQIEDEIWRKEIKIQSEGANGMEIVFRRFILSSNAIISFYTDSLEYQYKGTSFVHKPDSSYISRFFYWL